MKTSIRTSMVALMLVACGGSDSETGGIVGENELASGYPTDLAVTSPFAEGFAVETLTRRTPRLQTLDLPTIQDRKDEIADRLTAIDSNVCKFALRLFTPVSTAECYGPTIDYTGHPNGPPADGQLPSGDVGIWDENEASTGEACIAAKINSLIGEGQARVDMAIDLVTSMLCIAHVNGEDKLPGIGESKDLASSLSTLDLPLDIQTATFAREGDTEEGFATYLSTLSAGGSPDGKTIGTEINLRHIPTSEGNKTYEGKLWYTVTGRVGTTGNCGPGGSSLSAFSITYKKTSDTELTYRMQRADYCSDTVNPFDADYNLDPNASWGGNFNDMTFEMNPTNNTGVFSYAWQAGFADDHTRAFLAEINANSDGSVSGCGYFGFGPTVRSSDVGKIDGMICNWAGPNNTLTPQPIVQRQCVTLDTTTKKFVSDSAQLAISYAPTNSCDSAGAPFVFDGTSTAVTNNLVSIATLEADITPPAKP